MFQFPEFASHGLYIHPWMMPSGCPVTPGFPIRKSSDQSLFDSSPRHIAAYHVLHRLSTPRHPPCTLNSLTTIMRGCRESCNPRSIDHVQVYFQRLRNSRSRNADVVSANRNSVVARSLNLMVSSTIPGSPPLATSLTRGVGVSRTRRTCVHFFNCQRAPTTPPCQCCPARGRGVKGTRPRIGVKWTSS